MVRAAAMATVGLVIVAGVTAYFLVFPAREAPLPAVLDSREAGPAVEPAPIPNGTPRVAVDATKISLPPQPYFMPAEHTFAFRNTGDGVLKAEYAGKSCGCTSWQLSTKQLLPGESGTLKLGYAPKRHDDRKGPTSFWVALNTNDPELPVLRFDLDVDLRDMFACAPPKLDFGALQCGEQRELAWRVDIAGADERVGVKSVEATSPDIAIQPGERESTDGGAALHYTVTLTAPRRAGALRERIIVLPTDPVNPPMEVPVTAEIRLPIEITPAILDFGVLAPGETVSKPVYLLAGEQPSIRLGAVRSEEARINAVIESETPLGWKTNVTFHAENEKMGLVVATLEFFDEEGNSLGAISAHALVVNDSSQAG